MKAKLEFDLDDPSDRKAHKRCVSATDAYLCLHDIDNMLRQKIKYEYERFSHSRFDANPFEGRTESCQKQDLILIKTIEINFSRLGNQIALTPLMIIVHIQMIFKSD